MLIAFAGAKTGYMGNLSFEKPGNVFTNDGYIGMRQVIIGLYPIGHEHTNTRSR